MGKTIKFNKNDVEVNQEALNKVRHDLKKSKKLSKQEQGSKLHLKGHFQQQHHWPLVDETHRGRKI